MKVAINAWLLLAAALLLTALALVAPLSRDAHSAVRATAAALRVDVLVIEHTPIGAVERTGYLADWKYTGTAMFVEFTDDGDELFHNSFEAPSTCP